MADSGGSAALMNRGDRVRDVEEEDLLAFRTLRRPPHATVRLSRDSR
jgi:hypothetical protein